MFSTFRRRRRLRHSETDADVFDVDGSATSDVIDDVSVGEADSAELWRRKGHSHQDRVKGWSK